MPDKIVIKARAITGLDGLTGKGPRFKQVDAGRKRDTCEAKEWLSVRDRWSHQAHWGPELCSHRMMIKPQRLKPPIHRMERSLMEAEATKTRGPREGSV